MRGARRQERSPRAAVRELVVTAMAAGGRGVARDEGRVVLVSGVAPGDRVRAAIEGRHARALEVLAPGPDRVAPACPHVGACGGCDWMHLSVEAQAREHAALVGSAIAHALGVPAEDVQPTSRPAPAPLGFRTRARLAVRASCGRALVGYRAPSSHAIEAVASCAVLDPRLWPAVEATRELLAGSRVDGDAQIALGRGGSGPAPVLELRVRGELDARVYGALDAAVTSGAWAGARVHLEGARAPATFGDPRPVLEGPDGRPLVIDPGGFAQPSDAGATLLAHRVAALAEPAGCKVLELFAGSGTFSVLLAAEARSFASVEQSEPAALAARENLAARGLAGKVSVGDAAAFAVPRDLDRVILDPPRAGARAVARALAAARPRRIVYVACDPATLARDLAELCGGPGAGTAPRSGPFAVTCVETIELFPQTSHVETVVVLERHRSRP